MNPTEDRPTESGNDTAGFPTFDVQRTVIAVAYAPGDAATLLELLTVFRDDPRVAVHITIDSATPVHTDTSAFLHDHGIEAVDWDATHRHDAHLVLTASTVADVTGFDAPLVVLTSGSSLQRHTIDSATGQLHLHGVPSAECAKLPNLHMLVAHSGRQERLSNQDRDLAARTTVVGDPVHDRLIASQRMRHCYREELSISEDHQLILVAASSGPHSLLGHHPHLAERLLTQLPRDRYRVAAALHPDIWSWHGAWQVRNALHAAREAGLILLPPWTGWGAALVAADCVVADHGPLALYAAALDHPILLGTSEDTPDPDTPLAELAKSAPRLDPDDDLRRHVHDAITQHNTGRYAQVAEAAFDTVEATPRRIANQLYELLGLTGGTARLHTLTAPHASAQEPVAFNIRTRYDERGVLTVERFPATGHSREAMAEAPHNLTVVENADVELDDALAAEATVIACAQTLTLTEGKDWVPGALQRYPRSVMAAVSTPEGCLIALRDGPWLRMQAARGLDATLCAAVVHTRYRAGAVSTGDAAVRVGDWVWRGSVDPLS